MECKEGDTWKVCPVRDDDGMPLMDCTTNTRYMNVRLPDVAHMYGPLKEA